MKLYDTHADRSDADLQKLYSYPERTEKEVTMVLKAIEDRLKDPEDIGLEPASPSTRFTGGGGDCRLLL